MRLKNRIPLENDLILFQDIDEVWIHGEIMKVSILDYENVKISVQWVYEDQHSLLSLGHRKIVNLSGLDRFVENLNAI